jgi:anti-sigma factor RsiW
MMHLTNEQLIDYIHGALGPQSDADVYSHLEQCDACRKEHDAELSLTEDLRAYAARTQRELPATLKAAIWSEIRAARPSVWSRLGVMLRPSIAVPLAAVIALAAYFGTTYAPNGGAPAIEAAYYLQDHAALSSTVPFSDRNINPVDLENSAAASATQQTAVNVQAASYTADAQQ